MMSIPDSALYVTSSFYSNYFSHTRHIRFWPIPMLHLRKSYSPPRATTCRRTLAARILFRHLGIEVRPRVVAGRFGREPSSISGNYALGDGKEGVTLET